MSMLSITAVLSLLLLGQQPEMDDSPVTCSTENFSLPLFVDQAERNKIHRFKLYLSTDRGRKWKLIETGSAETKAFAFRSQFDGEHWFALQTVDKGGELQPANDKLVPNMKALVQARVPIAPPAKRQNDE